MNEYVLGILANMGLLSFLALSAYVLLIAGEMSFGQQAFFAIGAYSAAATTVLGALPLGVALALAAALGGIAGAALGCVTLRLRGLYFSMSTLAAAEAVRIFFELLQFQHTTADGDSVGPNGSEGFGAIRYVYEHGLGQGEFVLLIYAVLLLVLTALYACERAHFGVALRMVGEDPDLAGVLGINSRRTKLAAATVSGAIAAIGGGLYAHYNTYIEPGNFDVMLGIHSVAYALIGGLGTPLGSLLGVGADVLLLEGSRIFHGYRMIAFGGLVALFLIVRPRGLLDEQLVCKLRARVRRAPPYAGRALEET